MESSDSNLEELWALAQDLVQQEDPQALLDLIQVYEQMTNLLKPDNDPVLYASFQKNLGTFHFDLPLGDREINLQLAIEYFQEALRFLTPETAPLEYADTHVKLGTAFRLLLAGNEREAKLWRAIDHYQEALRFLAPETSPAAYALALGGLGTAFSEIPTDNRAGILEIAMAYYQEALSFLTPEDSPSEYANIQTSLGNAYSELPTGSRATNLEQAIACYQQVLRIWTPESMPAEYAGIQTNLGNAYRQLPTGNRAANLESAAAHYREALRYLSPETDPSVYALAQNGVGMVYSELQTGDRTENMERAIACFQEALRFLRPETLPLDYASAQTNLGSAYCQRPIGDRAANLEQAIARFQEALRFLTPETSPLDYAGVQTNLGSAYSELATGDRAANLEQAIAHFREALRFLTLETAPFVYGLAQNGLGLAYYALPTGDRAANLEQAIAHFREALRAWTLKATPLYYALAQNNLGSAYKNLPMENRSSNLAQAIACYKQARRIWSPEAAPFECRLVNRNLAHLHFDQKQWRIALRAYRAAMDAGERLYRAGLSAVSKATEIAANADLYPHAAFAAVRCGKTAEAFLILEQGKTRLLTEALRLRIPRPANVPDETWKAYERAATEVRSAQSASITSPGVASLQPNAYHEQATRPASATLDAAIELVRAYAPEFLRPIDLPAMQALFSDALTVLVAFCITNQGSVGFVVGPGHEQDVRVIRVPHFTRSVLRRLLVERDAEGRATGGWLVDYVLFLEEGTETARIAWQSTITSTLAKLSRHLLAPILATIPAGTKRLIFLPSAELYLLPLHAAPLSNTGVELVCDRYVVSYAPSVEVLVSVRHRAALGGTPDLYAVVNPTADPSLPFTSIEGRAIAQLFKHQYVRVGHQAGKKQGVIEGVTGRRYVHFSCHGSYNWSDPPQSGLELADGRLTLAELEQGAIDLSAARLVTLSACETGISDVLKGSPEEYVGIPAGFLLAGVPCMVSSLWSVPDISTALLMERFYRNHLSKGVDFAAALREAQLWVRDLQIGEVAQYAEQCYQQARQDEQAELYRQMRYYHAQAEQNPARHPFAHPYYWAAFTVNGM